MNVSEFKSIRKKIALTQKDLANLLGFKNAQTVKNIEAGTYNAGRLAIKVLRYINSLPEKKAQSFIEELNQYDPE